MNFNKPDNELKMKVKINVEKLEKSKKNKPMLLAQTIYLGTVGIIFILPVIIGAYVGVWLDDKMKNFFSISWTISLIIVGIFVGAISIYLFIKE